MSNKTFSRSIPVLGLSVLLSSACGNATTVDERTIESDGQSTSAGAIVPHDISTDGALHTMTVYKSPTCGCCQEWMDYMAEEGFSVEGVETENVDAVKSKHGLTAPELKSCHTAIVDGYVVEGHVPAADVKRLLAERPDIVGLTAPGMPMMSPGMASRTPKDYDVLAFQKDGGTRIWSSY